MPKWLADTLDRIRRQAAGRDIRFTLKALREMAALGLDEEDACEILSALSATESAGRRKSARTGEWMYIFKPELSGAVIYVKLILRPNCVLISFHEDEPDEEADE